MLRNPNELKSQAESNNTSDIILRLSQTRELLDQKLTQPLRSICESKATCLVGSILSFASVGGFTYLLIHQENEDFAVEVGSKVLYVAADILFGAAGIISSYLFLKAMGWLGRDRGINPIQLTPEEQNHLDISIEEIKQISDLYEIKTDIAEVNIIDKPKALTQTIKKINQAKQNLSDATEKFYESADKIGMFADIHQSSRNPILKNISEYAFGFQKLNKQKL